MATNIKKNCGIVLLAAGSSSRMGRPKQLLPYTNKNILQHSIDTAIGSGAIPVFLVLGANAGMIEKEINTQAVTIVYNSEWEKGMASSISKGLISLLDINPLTEAAIFMVCDQPYISSKLLTDLINRKLETGKTIVASSYQNTMGTSVLFDKRFFEILLKSEGDSGAKKMIMQHLDSVALIDFPQGFIDIDTMEDYEALLKKIINK